MCGIWISILSRNVVYDYLCGIIYGYGYNGYPGLMLWLGYEINNDEENMERYELICVKNELGKLLFAYWS